MEPLILPFEGNRPELGDGVFVAPGATVIGRVAVGADTNIWYGCVLRGDVERIHVGARTNIQDGTIVHVTTDRFGAHIGSDVTIGHACVIHGATLEDDAFVGMRATVLDGAVVEGGAMVAANALVGPGKRVPRGELWAGVPAKKVRDLSEAEIAELAETPPHYVDLARRHQVALRER